MHLSFAFWRNGLNNLPELSFMKYMNLNQTLPTLEGLMQYPPEAVPSPSFLLCSVNQGITCHQRKQLLYNHISYIPYTEININTREQTGGNQASQARPHILLGKNFHPMLACGNYSSLAVEVLSHVETFEPHSPLGAWRRKSQAEHHAGGHQEYLGPCPPLC